MLVSWKWLSRYVDLSMPIEELESRLAMSGLNHESTTPVGDDFLIDLEVTSNRGDCLGHIGVAREVAVLYDKQLRTPIVDLAIPDSAAGSATVMITNDMPEACSLYTARLVHGIKVGPSPEWLAQSLATIGVPSINNVVDATNYVMFECGQPTHAFDFDRLSGGQIVVRPGAKDEKIVAIDHRTYELDADMCVIADAKAAVGIAGVMGGEASEVTTRTKNILIEAAIFAPLSVRRTARRLKLGSAASYRFERRVDPAGVDWASRRVCELVISSGGGEVSEAFLAGEAAAASSTPVVLHYSQIRRLLGIEIDRGEVIRILTALGCVSGEVGPGKPAVSIRTPSWRHDLTREVDLIEEVARIHGYDKIPENHPIAVVPSAKRPFDVAVEKLHAVMMSAGFCEAMTPSIVTDKVDSIASPWTDRASLATVTPMLEGARRLRRSLAPSLLQSRAANWAAASVEADLFEIAHIYLPAATPTDAPLEQYSIGLVSGRDYFFVKGVIDAIAMRLGIAQPFAFASASVAGFDPAWSTAIQWGDRVIGYQGAIEAKIQKEYKLPGTVIVAELSLMAMLEASQLVPQQKGVNSFPAIVRDLNFIVNEDVRWSALEHAVRAAASAELQDVVYRETYRNPVKDGENRKRILLSVELRKQGSTLTHAEAETLVRSILQSCEQQTGAKLLE